MTNRLNIKNIPIISDLSNLIFPQACLSCEKELSKTEKHLCTFCYNDLTLTNFQLFEEPTVMDKLFWGRSEVSNTYAHVFFDKEKASQNILFNLKYKNNKQIGIYFGAEMGKKLAFVEYISSIDALIPVPLHYKKEFIRGYNQSEVLANGMAQVLNIPVNTKLIQRSKHTESQTKKSRFQRWDNVHDIFKVNKKVNSYKHVLLIDDVITTGSTIESIILALRKKNPNLLISVATLAIA